VAVNEDPFLAYGAGVTVYFKLQQNLIKLFVALSVFAFIQMYIYSSFGGMDFLALNEDFTMRLPLRTSIGNMGSSGAICSIGPIDWNTASSNLTF
jgi:hypothetical protein